MRKEPNLKADSYRDQTDPMRQSKAGANWGLFKIGELRVISSGTCDDNPTTRGWEHVSVSLPNRCPTWSELDKVKKVFWRDDETVIQFHPRESAKINFHPYCLHLWKKDGTEFELPPDILV